MSIRKGTTIISGKGANGTNGQDGQDGQDGFSPIATVSKSGSTATISITDKNGTTTAQVSDGATYTLPTASSSTLGGIKVGTNLSIDGSGVLSASGGTAPIYYWDRTNGSDSKTLLTELVEKYKDSEPFVLIARYYDSSSATNVSNLCLLALNQNINGDGYIYEVCAGDTITHKRHSIYVDSYTVTSITLNSATISGATESWVNTWFLNKYNTSSYTPSNNYNPATKKYVDDGLTDKQDTLVSGTNIKTINNTSLLGSGNISVGGGGTATDVQINGTSIVSSNTANILTEGTYNSTSNKIATMSDLPANSDFTLNGLSEKSYTNLTDKPTIPTNSEIADLIYPVGSIYMSVNSTSPATLFGGTWQQIEDTFLLSAGSTYTAGATGGEATHTLTIDEMPSHNHGLYSRNTYQSGTTGAINGWNTGGTSYNTKNTGGGGAHNNMPPYLVVYMWQRTA